MTSRALPIALCLAAACGAAHRGEPAGPPVRPDTRAEQRGQHLFAEHCYPCHPGGAAGLGPALNDKPLPEVAIRTQIRRGLGAMPAFSPDLLGDADVAAVADYVKDMRQTRPSR